MRRTTKFVPVLIVAAAVTAACQKAPEPAAPAEPATEAPPAPPPVSNDARTLSIGTLSAYALRDGGLKLPNDNQVLGVKRTPEEVAALLSAAGLPTDEIQLSIQPLLVKTTDRVLLFDTGAGSNMGADAGHLPTSLDEAGVTPESVTDVFISHLHGDHIGGLVNAAGTAVFPNAAVHLSEAEWKALGALKPEQATAYGIAQLPALLAAITPKVATFKADAEIIPGVVRAVDVKGHTPGHSAYLIGNGTDTLLYIGDTMHHSVISVQKPEWAIAFDGNADRASKSRVELLEKSAASGQRIYAVHFPYPGVGHFEKQEAGGFSWVAE